MTWNGRVFTLKFTTKSISPKTTLPKLKSMPTPSSQEKGASTCIPANTVATTAPPMGKEVTNKVAEATSSKWKEVVDVEAPIENHKKNVSPKESQEFLRLIRKSDFKIMDQLGQAPSKISIL